MISRDAFLFPQPFEKGESMVSLKDLPKHVRWIGSQLKPGVNLTFSLVPVVGGSVDARMLWVHIMEDGKKQFEIHLQPCVMFYLDSLEITPKGLGYLDEELEELARHVQKIEVRMHGESSVLLMMYIDNQDCPQIWQYQPSAMERSREDLFEDPRNMALQDGLPLWQPRPIRIAA